MKKICVFLFVSMLLFGAVWTEDGIAGLRQPTPQLVALTPRGEIDAKLVGAWEYSTIDDLGATYHFIYTFGDDGCFSYYERAYRVTTTVNGSYTASNGRVYLSDLADEEGFKWSDQTLEYSFGTNKDGEFLLIQELLSDGTLLEKMEFRRSGN